jgi:hypothetical protein
MVLKLGQLPKYIRNARKSFEMLCWRRMENTLLNVSWKGRRDGKEEKDVNRYRIALRILDINVLTGSFLGCWCNLP